MTDKTQEEIKAERKKYYEENKERILSNSGTLAFFFRCHFFFRFFLSFFLLYILVRTIGPS